jgi:predicted permease
MLPPHVRRVFRLPVHRSDIAEAYADDEIRAHLETRAEALMARGMSPDEAKAEALRRFGSLPEARAKMHEAARRRERRLALIERADELRRDLSYAARQLRASPGFTAGVVLTFALGIGANAAMFGIIDRLLLRGPAHVRDPERVVRLYYTTDVPGQGSRTRDDLGYVAFRALRDRTPSLDAVAAYSYGDATLGRGVDAREISEGHATSTFFPLLGARPYLGRFFQADEDQPGSPQYVAVLGHSLWRTHFGADSGIVGKTIVLGHEPYAVIGVAPDGFTGAELNPIDVWIPMSVRGARIHPDWIATWNATWLGIIGRLAPGATVERASQEATAAIRAAYDGDDPAMPNVRGSFRPIRFGGDGKEPAELAVSRWLTGVAVIVLLIVCANVANLLLARGVRREREIAVRLALGASGGRVARLVLAEILLLALLGGVAGLALAHEGGQLVRLVLLPDVAWHESALDGRVLTFTAIASIIVGIVIGLVPAMQASRLDLNASLKAGVREGGGRRARLRTTLTIAQAALSAVLLVGAGLFMRSLQNVASLPHGLEPERVLAVAIHWPNPNVMRLAGKDVDGERARQDAFYTTALERVRQLPGVERASIAIGTPFHGMLSMGLQVPGRDSIPTLPGAGPYPYVSAVTSDHFATVGTRLLRGRAFTPRDRAGSERVAVVNRTMARTLWPTGDAIGQCLIIMREPCSRVVGVVEDARRSSLEEQAAMQYYIPLGQEGGMGGRNILVRPLAPPGSRAFRQVATALRAELLRMKPDLGYVEIETLQQAFDWQIRPWRLGATMFGIFGGLALIVAAVGLYSVVAYSVEQRRHELGVRLALGAQRATIVRLILRDGIAAAVIGLAMGLALALAGGRFIEPLLFHVAPDDPVVLVIVGVTLLAVASAAAIVPALRGVRVDPMEALRAE